MCFDVNKVFVFVEVTFTSVPILVKIFKLTVFELGNLLDAKAPLEDCLEDEDCWEDEDGTDEVGDDFNDKLY